MKNKILNAINEGIKSALIDFGNDKILKSTYVDNIDIIIEKLNNLINLKEISKDLYKELCKAKYIGIYKVYHNSEINDIISYIGKVPYLNLNWIDISGINNFLTKYTLLLQGSPIMEPIYDLIDISLWPLTTIYLNLLSTYNINCKNIKLPNTTITIDSDAFMGNRLLKYIKIPDNTKHLKDGVFFNCSSLLEVELPYGLLSILACAFSECNVLEKINIPETVTRLDEFAFNHTNLSSITIPNSITYIDNNAFGLCENLYNINFNGSKHLWSQISFNEKWKEDSPIKTITCNDGVIKITDY